MAELSLRERLQPALLDRLIDDERVLTLFEFTFVPQELQRAGFSVRGLQDVLAAQGLRASDLHGVAAVEQAGDQQILRYIVANGRVSPAQLKSLQLKAAGASTGVALQSLCKIEARNLANSLAEPPERRYASVRRLREWVQRDLAALLNSLSYEGSADLSRYPHVASSVLNYGMPSLAGVSAAAVDAVKTAAAIEEAIRRFEPRLLKVRVTPDTDRADGDGHQLAFRIEADLWGQPAPQHLVLRTRIDTESGNVNVAESGAR